MNRLHPIALAWLLIAPTAAPAQEKARTRSQADAERAAAVARLPRGPSFRSGGDEYRIVGGVRSFPRAAHESEAQALSRLGASPGDVIDRKGQYYLVVRARAATTATVPRSGYLTAVNGRTGQLAVLSGELEVRLRKGADPEALARAHALAVVFSAPRLSMTVLRVPPGADLASISAELARDPAVESVEIEAIEHLASPR